jgi:HlyD family secretion protein
MSEIKLLPLFFLLLLAGCDQTLQRLPGYVEGDYVHVAAPQSGRLMTLAVAEGDELKTGSALFALEADPEQSAVAAAQANLQEREAELADQNKGKRPDELAQLESQLRAAEASVALARTDLVRQQQLARQKFVSASTLDNYATQLKKELGNRDALAAELRTARLAARDDQLTAARQAVDAARAELQHQQWALDQKQQHSQIAGRVEEILYRRGEWVPAGAPVMTLLPVDGIKARFYLPETRRPELHPGSAVTLYCDGCQNPIPAHVSYIANQVEFTPPVIYSEENRSRLVFLVEARPDAGHDWALHPGQPLEVALEPQK